MPTDFRRRLAMAITNRDLPEGAILVGRYKGQVHRVLVLKDDRGSRATSSTAARSTGASRRPGSAATGGKSCNGWDFFSVDGEEP
jgi:hypothetical protein